MRERDRKKETDRQTETHTLSEGENNGRPDTPSKKEEKEPCRKKRNPQMGKRSNQNRGQWLENCQWETTKDL